MVDCGVFLPAQIAYKITPLPVALSYKVDKVEQTRQYYVSCCSIQVTYVNYQRETCKKSQKICSLTGSLKSNSRKFVPAKHKKSAIREIKPPLNFYATR